MMQSSAGHDIWSHLAQAQSLTSCPILHLPNARTLWRDVAAALHCMQHGTGHACYVVLSSIRPELYGGNSWWTHLETEEGFSSPHNETMFSGRNR